MHFLPGNVCSTSVQALDFKLLADVLNVFVHLDQGEHLPTIKNTVHNSVGAFFCGMLFQMLSNHLPAFLTVWTRHQGVEALVQMLVDIANLEDLVAVLVGAID